MKKLQTQIIIKNIGLGTKLETQTMEFSADKYPDFKFPAFED